jgi:hypothetical protein
VTRPISYHTTITVSPTRDGWAIECSGAYVHRGPLDVPRGARWPTVARAVVDYLGDTVAHLAHPAAWERAGEARSVRVLWAGLRAP